MPAFVWMGGIAKIGEPTIDDRVIDNLRLDRLPVPIVFPDRASPLGAPQPGRSFVTMAYETQRGTIMAVGVIWGDYVVGQKLACGIGINDYDYIDNNGPYSHMAGRLYHLAIYGGRSRPAFVDTSITIHGPAKPIAGQHRAENV